MKTGRIWTIAFVAAAAVAGGVFTESPRVQAQPAANGAPAGGPMDWNNMTAEQRREARQRMREPMLRALLDQGDFNEQTEIAPILQFATAQEDARNPIRELSRTIAQKLIEAGTTEEQITQLLKDLKQDTQAEHDWRPGAVKMLDEMTAYSKKPRLEALLTVLGYTGDEASFIDGISGLNTVALDRARRDGETTNWPELSPEERRQANATAREHGLRSLLAEAGITEKPVLDAIVAFVNEKDKAREPLRETAAQLLETVNGAATGDAQVPGLLTQLRKAVTAEKERYKTAVEALDTNIGYTRKPRLEAALTVLGVIGDEAVSMEGTTVSGSVVTRRQGGMPRMANWGSAAMRPVIERFQAMTPEQRRQLFSSFSKQFDTDGNGRVDRTERAQGHERLMKRFDKNGNGQLDPDELMRTMDSF